VFLLALGRGLFDAPPVPHLPGGEWPPGGQEETRWGRWRELGRGRGYLEPDPPGSPPELTPVLYRCDAPPTEGDRVLVLGGGTPVPYPRGELPGRSRREGWRATRHLAADELVVLETAQERALAATALERLRGRIRRRLASLEGERGRGLLRALILGERDGLPRGRSDLFTRTGTRHLLALSGLHVALFAALVLFPLTGVLGRALARVRPALEEPVVAVARALSLVGYALIAGGGPPVVRAALASGLALFASWIPCEGWTRGAPRRAPGRRADPLSIWGAALAWECLADPAGIERLSLRLSYLATLGILLGARPIAAWLAPSPVRGRLENELVAAPRRLARLILGRLRRGLTLALAVSLAACLTTLPLLWGSFGELAPIGILLSVPASLLVGAFTALGWCALLSPVALLDPLLGPLIEATAELLVGLLEWADHGPATPLPLPPRPGLLLALVPLATLVSLSRDDRAGRIAGRGALLVAGGLLLPCTLAPSGFELCVLDVGHGTAALMRAPGLPALVFDAGSRDREGLFREALGPQLAAWDVSRPEVFLSHADHDHTSGLETLVQRHPPRRWIGPLPPGLEAEASLEVLQGRTRILAGAPPELRLEAVRGQEGAGNEGSSALLLRYRDQSLVLFGDAEEEGLRRTLELLPPGPIRLLFFPHHGSETSHLARLLEHLRPEEIWISAARRPAVADELTRRRIPWSWTGSGALALDLPFGKEPGGAPDRPRSSGTSPRRPSQPF